MSVSGALGHREEGSAAAEPDLGHPEPLGPDFSSPFCLDIVLASNKHFCSPGHRSMTWDTCSCPSPCTGAHSGHQIALVEFIKFNK